MKKRRCMRKPKYVSHGELSGDLCQYDGTPMVIHQTEEGEWIITCPECFREIPYYEVGAKQYRLSYA